PPIPCERLDVNDASVEIDLAPPQIGHLRIACAGQDQQPNDRGIFELRRAHLAVALFGEAPHFSRRDQIGAAVIALPDFERMLIKHIARPDGFDFSCLDPTPDDLLSYSALPRSLRPPPECGVGAGARCGSRVSPTR